MKSAQLNFFLEDAVQRHNAEDITNLTTYTNDIGLYVDVYTDRTRKGPVASEVGIKSILTPKQMEDIALFLYRFGGKKFELSAESYDGRDMIIRTTDSCSYPAPENASEQDKEIMELAKVWNHTVFHPRVPIKNQLNMLEILNEDYTYYSFVSKGNTSRYRLLYQHDALIQRSSVSQIFKNPLSEKKKETILWAAEELDFILPVSEKSFKANWHLYTRNRNPRQNYILTSSGFFER